MPPPERPAGSASAEPTFEAAIEEVEAIIRRIEAGEVGLEQSIEQYERGVKLIKQCRTVLDRVEQRVTDLTAQMQADATTLPTPPESSR